jgi:hypothetical protein
MSYRLGHLDLAGTLGAADIADGGGEELADARCSWGHPGTVPRATVIDDPSGREGRYGGVSPGPFGYIRSLIERGRR